MKIKQLHNWNLKPKEAIDLQKELSKQLSIKPLNQTITFVAGTDVAYYKKEETAYAAISIYKLPELIEIESIVVKEKISFPYIPGLLSFREIPALYKAFEKVNQVPDVIICDGQGIAHPRSLGLASHLGVLLQIPTIGCAKSLLVGEYDSLEIHQWSTSPLIYRDKIIGLAVRSRKSVKPLFISPGNFIDMNSSLNIIKSCVTRFRLPEPIRSAHRLSQR